MKVNFVFAMIVLFAVGIGLRAQSQPVGAIPRTMAYKLGQVWTMEHGVTVTILAIEDLPKVGRIVHVRVDNIPWQSCGDIHLTRAIEHVAVTEKMLRMSGLAMAKENVSLPQSSIEALRKWEGQKPKKREVSQFPLSVLIRAQGNWPGGPMICDVFPKPPSTRD